MFDPAVISAVHQVVQGRRPAIPSRLAPGRAIDPLYVLATHPLFFTALAADDDDGELLDSFRGRLQDDPALADVVVAFNPQGLLSLAHFLPSASPTLRAFYRDPFGEQARAAARVAPFAREVVALRVPWMSGPQARETGRGALLDERAWVSPEGDVWVPRAACGLPAPGPRFSRKQ